MTKIGYIADLSSKQVAEAVSELQKKYQLVNLSHFPENPNIDYIITLGGDGIMLKALHYIVNLKVPVFGMNKGSIGFLLNDYSCDNLEERIKSAKQYTISPLQMHSTDIDNNTYTDLAINEVSLFRELNQATKIIIHIDDVPRLDCFMGDGILVATPAGSTAYNLAINGPIIPLDATLLALTPISPFRPRRWKGVLLSQKHKIGFEILEPQKRPVSAVADYTERRNVKFVSVTLSNIKLQILFDSKEDFDERILKEQFI